MLKIVFLVLLAVNINNIDSHLLENGFVQDEGVFVDVQDILENVKEEIRSLEVTVHLAVDEALTWLNKLLETRLGSVDELLNLANGEFNISKSEFSLTIQAYKDRANSIGVDISECLTEEEELYSLLAKADETVDKYAQEGRDSIVNANVLAQTSIKNTLDLVDDLNNQATKCAASSTAEKCWTQLDVTVKELAMSLPSQIKGYVSDALLSAIVSEEKIISGANQALKSTLKRVTELMTNGRKCANEKFSQS